jgi:hypothetical protein
LYEIVGGAPKIVARSSKAARDSGVAREDVHGLQGSNSKGVNAWILP